MSRASSILTAALQITTTLTPALVFFSPGEAAAQETGADTVVLRDGGMLKGSLIEILPGDHVTLQLSNGQSARIRWDVIDHIIRNGVPLNTAQPAPTTTTQTPPPAPTEQGSVLVHIDGDVDLEAESMTAPTGKRVSGGWATMCSAPCDQEMPLSAVYRLAGSGVRASRTFKLAGKPGDHVYISADPGSKGGFVGGIVLIGVGVPVFVIGCFVELVVGIVNLASHGTDYSSGSYVDTSGPQVVGLSMMGLGVAGVITGIVLVASNGSTKLDQTITAPGQPPPKSADLGADVFKKIPVYATHEGPRLPVPETIPIITGHF